MTKPRVRINGATGRPVARYDGATQGRRAANWLAPTSGPNASLTGNLPTLRNRSRDAYRNNPLISLGIGRGVSNEIGTGVVPRFLSKDEAFVQVMSPLFDQWALQCDPEGVLDYYGIQSQLCRSRRTSGEVFVRLRRRSITSNLAIPIQIQVLESDFVPVELFEVRSNGNKIKAGIEFNNRGQRVAYWMYPEHPNERNHGIYSNSLIRVPASDVIHHYLPTRPGQSRGEPDTVQSLLKAHTFDTYDDAELLRKQTKAPYTGFLTRDSYTEDDYLFDPFSGQPTAGDGLVPELNVQAGSILTGFPGEKLELFKGDDTGSGYADFMREQKLSIAAGLGLPYELMTGDWSKINDRLYRALINEYRREVEAVQDQLTIFQCCRRIVDWAIRSAVFTLIAPAQKYRENVADYHNVEHRPQGWKHIHPEQDVNAAIKAIEADLVSLDRVVASQGGWDGEENIKQNLRLKKRKQELEKEYGITSESEG